jgi:PLD-like domain
MKFVKPAFSRIDFSTNAEISQIIVILLAVVGKIPRYTLLTHRRQEARAMFLCGDGGSGKSRPARIPEELRMALRLSLVLALLGLFILLAFARPAGAEPVEIHYAPVENLEHVDVELLRSARAKIDMAAYSLTDWSIIDTLIDAHRRGVAVWIVLDPSQQHALDRMREIAGNIRMKAPGPYKHLKSYAVDELVA